MMWPPRAPPTRSNPYRAYGALIVSLVMLALAFVR